MSVFAAKDARCIAREGSVDLTIEPREKDLGDFSVRRVLPAPARRMVGPFIFFDHMGPARFPAGKGINVRPHPHIGIATVTYLFEGQIMHRDSLGFAQPIEAGAVNLMTAGCGIVHSERAGDDLDRVSRLHGIQSWIALPEDKAEMAPAFSHHPAASIPQLAVGGATVRVILGETFSRRSPVPVYSPTLYLELLLPAAAALVLPREYSELAFYVVEGAVEVGEREFPRYTMAVATPGEPIEIRASRDSRVMVIGGEPVGKRFIWWNFVAASRERIATASADWKAGRFDPVPGDDEFIPLPE
jgi:redox-sensitive bicupin YhaK (pirin superfamily)